jgi:hypothetical protein
MDWLKVLSEGSSLQGAGNPPAPVRGIALTPVKNYFSALFRKWQSAHFCPSMLTAAGC